MKLIIAGGRNYKFTADDGDHLYKLDENEGISEVVSGGSTGADYEGECWGHVNMIEVTYFKADWKTHGKAAGPIRNRQMAEYADALAVFHGGRGTANMVKTAKELGLTVYDFRKGC